jgi:hypothetical protein
MATQIVSLGADTLLLQMWQNIYLAMQLKRQVFLEITRHLLLTLFFFLFYTLGNQIYIYICIYIYCMFCKTKMTARFADLHRGKKKLHSKAVAWHGQYKSSVLSCMLKMPEFNNTDFCPSVCWSNPKIFR